MCEKPWNLKKCSIHEYFTRCTRTSSEHLNVLESINSLSVLTRRPHSLTVSLPFCLSLCLPLPTNGHTQGYPFKGPPHPATAVPWGVYVKTMLPGIELKDGRGSQWGSLPLSLWWRGSIGHPFTPTLCFVQTLMMKVCLSKTMVDGLFCTGLSLILTVTQKNVVNISF